MRHPRANFQPAGDLPPGAGRRMLVANHSPTWSLDVRPTRRPSPRHGGARRPCRRPDTSPRPQTAGHRPRRSVSSTLPTPNLIRTASGRPGSRYWQQRADYRIDATLDPATHELRGRETIHYHQQLARRPALPLALPRAEHLRPTSITEQLDQPPLVFLGIDLRFLLQGIRRRPRRSERARRHRGAEARDLRHHDAARSPRAAGGGRVVDLTLAWRFTVPDYGAGRMGRDGALYRDRPVVPRMAVYDDVRGWNHDPYIGAGEFYLEYGSFDVAPHRAGQLHRGGNRNARGIRSWCSPPAQRERLARAGSSASRWPSITARRGGAPPTGPGRAASGTAHLAVHRRQRSRLRVRRRSRFPLGCERLRGHSGPHAVSPVGPGVGGSQPDGAGRRSSTSASSGIRYPYPHISSVEGPIEGMEYPCSPSTLERPAARSASGCWRTSWATSGCR